MLTLLTNQYDWHGIITGTPDLCATIAIIAVPIGVNAALFDRIPQGSMTAFLTSAMTHDRPLMSVYCTRFVRLDVNFSRHTVRSPLKFVIWESRQKFVPVAQRAVYTLKAPFFESWKTIWKSF
jgi:hypothetical protein